VTYTLPSEQDTKCHFYKNKWQYNIFIPLVLFIIMNSSILSSGTLIKTGIQRKKCGTCAPNIQANEAAIEHCRAPNRPFSEWMTEL